jgi:hypothetical protein
MADFAEAITHERAGRGLARAIQGKGAFRRFKDELHKEYPDLLPGRYAFRDVRARRRAVQWLAGNSLIQDDTASLFLASHPDPDLPRASRCHRLQAHHTSRMSRADALSAARGGRLAWAGLAVSGEPGEVPIRA